MQQDQLRQHLEDAEDEGRNKNSNRGGGSGKTYIAKPEGGSQGDGIYLFKRWGDYRAHRHGTVVSEYIDPPLLLDGFKFDLRLYVLVKSLDPLKVYLCDEGLARLCTTKYCEPTAANLHQSYMHLTNYR
jgi:tubulin polyglutamylase TTLL11